MICDWKCDTKEPRNLNDADIDENTAELPPPRPESEFTTTLGLIARRRMYVALGTISDITSALQSCSYVEIMRADGILQEAAASIPPPLKPRPLANSVTDAPEIIMARLFIANLLYKGQIMLHRRFLYAESTSSSEDVFAYSRTACLDASLGALQIQNILDEETSPGGQLHMMRWRISSIMNHTFLTATMILCSMLHRGSTFQRENEILTALRRTRTTWMRASSHSKEAKKAADTVSIVVARATGLVHIHKPHSIMATTNAVSTASNSSDMSGFGGPESLLQDNTDSVFPPHSFIFHSPTITANIPEPIAVIGSGSLVCDPFCHPVGTHHGTTNAIKSYWLEDSDRSDVTKFDAGFFNIQPGDVDAMDPQQRLLLEVVYDALCAGGQPIEKLRGSDTSVYVGMMCDDYNTMLVRDWESLPRYAATGLERAIASNRVSYFFDWHGPSMTVDTACSSSLVALDMAVQALRSGTSTVAVAAGTSLLLSPAMYISESKLGMLSPTGRCAMWDAAADGYTRGEGVAAVIVKTLSQALADNDPIECIIRETAVNQDGRTPGLTMPSNTAQAALIRECYARAGLNPVNSLKDRPQLFHAPGTGTQAGDPQEAEAISSALFPAGSFATKHANKLLVGSIKTVIGHTEGTAGLASVIGTAQALRKATVPPNLHFHNLNPKVAPFFDHLEIPTVPTPWLVSEGQVRRASMNSFGFGGTNAHCILEEFPSAKPATSLANNTPGLQFTPLTFSAASETALKATLSQYLQYLQENPSIKLSDLAYTLQHRRSTLNYRKAVASLDVQDAIKNLGALVNASPDSKEVSELGIRFGALSRSPKLLGVFTGQGAQWPRMGAQLIETSPFAEARIDELDAALQALPNPSDRPSWTLKDQLLAGKDTSRIAEAALSQPLCTAVQVILVDILRQANISFTAAVGHSSGEIGAVYAAGLVSAEDAIRIAYFRGVHAKLASSPNSHAPRGSMMAVGTSFDEARGLCENLFKGRLQVAAVNSASSITLSGDEDAVDEAERLLKAQGIFARKLKVDTAYHSEHMKTCAGPYLGSLNNCKVKSQATPTGTTTPMTRDTLSNQYWVDNMCNAVLFEGALARAELETGPFDLAIEVGPHPALKGPATSTIGDVPYTGLLSRDLNDALLSGTRETNTVLTDLPAYPYDRLRTYWASSRVSNHFKHRRAIHAPNPVLGSPCSEAITSGEFSWRNMLCPDEMAWLKGHMLQGQTVFPATGYVSMAIEAIKGLVLDSTPKAVISVFKVTDTTIPRALAFDSDDGKIETVFNVSLIDNVTELDVVTAEWTCYMVTDGAGTLVLNAKGRVAAHLASASSDTLPLVKSNPYNLVYVGDEQFYSNLETIGYGYGSPFKDVSDIQRKPGYSIGTLYDQSGNSWEDNLIIHPGMLDSVLQTIFAAWSYPKDTQLWSLHVPISISAVTINSYFTPMGEGGKQGAMRYKTYLQSKEPSKVTGDVFLHTAADDAHAFVQLEGVALVPFSPATSKLDLPMFSKFHHSVISPDGELAAAGERLSAYEVKLYNDIERVSYWFACNASISIPVEKRSKLLPHFQRYLSWCDRMVDMVSRGAHANDVARILAPYNHRKDVRFVEVIGDNIYMNQDGLLRAFYEENALCGGPSNRWLAHILEVGAGTGATTASVLEALGDTYASYTFSDISSDFFKTAEERLAEKTGHQSGQGLAAGSYDLITAVNALHVSTDVDASLVNVCRLLKPGGYLVVGELTSTDLLFTGTMVGTLPNWWVGAETGRQWGPLLSLSEWDALLKRTGFSGLDTVTPDISASFPMSVFVTQAVNDQERPAGVKNDGLAIIGGSTWPVHQLGRAVHDVLDHRWHNKQFFTSVQDYASSPLAQSAATNRPVAVLCLTDLDKPYLQDIKPDKFAALKVFAGSKDGAPFSYEMRGVMHTVKTEIPSLNIQMYDLLTLLRHHVLFSWNMDSDTMLWSAEPEIYVRNQRQLITRLLPDSEKNARYNARRRDIWTAASPAKENLEIVASGQEKHISLELQKASPLRLSIAPAGSRTIRLTHSLLQSIAVSGVDFLRLCAGMDIETSEAVLALTGSNELLVKVPASWCIPLTANTVPIPLTLISLAANLIAHHILSVTPYGSTLIIHEADSSLRSALVAQATAKELNVIFTTSELRVDKVGISTFLHPNFTRSTIESVIPSSTAVFVGFSRGAVSNAVRETIIKALPRAPHEVVGSLHTAIDLASQLQRSLEESSSLVREKSPLVTLAEISKHSAVGERLAVIDWASSSSVQAKAQPIDSGVLFRPDRTYFFAGMAGQIGQSLADWAISHGARYVVLTSRNLKVNPKFIADMSSRYGATVQPMSVDVTSLESIQSALSTIRETLPPIAGVVDGAMILDDGLFVDMPYEQFMRVNRPKVIGTQLLDQLFYDDTSLDFFIVTSSIASVIGFSGQSNYAAANEFMSGIIRDRRRRGVVGSSISIPGVLGVGVAANEAEFDFEYFQSIGYINISEEDLHQLFAEAMLSGKSGEAEVPMGVNYLSADAVVKEAHKRDVKFCHFVKRDEDSDGGNSSAQKSKAVKVKVQLQNAKSREEAYEILRDGFVANLKRMLRMGEDSKVEENVPLVEQGVDSLGVVDIRSWFLKEVMVDVSALKVLGGGSVKDLVGTALEKMAGLTKKKDEKKKVVIEVNKGRQIPESPQSRGSPVFTPAVPLDGSSGATTPRSVVEKVGSNLKSVEVVLGGITN
ncbi:polyketide synthase [Podospora fimiseda]|uniref:Polyketide synthase n=1 Tax=Podospora fimiseda TaxID=252190 RepID=A0AAN7BZC6_9PEZI|nr:polyketide synthase [Podospora fimiseda]